MGEDELKNFENYLSTLSNAESNVTHTDYAKYEKNAEEKILKKLKFRKTQKNSITSFIVSLNFISIFSIALIFTFYFVLTSLNQTVNQSELQMEILDVEKLIENIDIQEEIEVIEW